MQQSQKLGCLRKVKHAPAVISLRHTPCRTHLKRLASAAWIRLGLMLMLFALPAP